MYPMTADPPSLTGAVQDTTTSALPAVAATPVGAPGTVLGVTAALGSDAGEVPAGLVAVTVNLYEVPFVSPVTVAEAANQEAHAVLPPGEEVIVYPVIAEPPSLTGAVHVTNPAASPAVAVTAVG